MKAPAASEAQAVNDKLLPKYERRLADFPATGKVLTSCLPPKPKLHKETRRYRTAIASAFRERGARPNFCAKYFLMTTPITGGGDIYLFDCETGAPTVQTLEFAVASVLFKPGSCAYVTNPPSPDHVAGDFATSESGFKPEPVSGAPKTYRFEAGRISLLKDEIWPR